MNCFFIPSSRNASTPSAGVPAEGVEAFLPLLRVEYKFGVAERVDAGADWYHGFESGLEKDLF